MQAVILAGGAGTRLRPFTMTVPKPLLPIGDKPILGILLDQLKRQGFTRIQMCVGYLAPLFQAWFGNGAASGVEVEFVVEKQPLGTAGALGLIPDLDENFLVVNGDTLTDLNFPDLLAAHVACGAYATIFSAKVEEFIDYGMVEFDPATRHLTRYTEKPTRCYHVSTGIYALSRRILDYGSFGGERRLDMPDLLRAAADAGRPILCYTQESAYWRDIGRFDHYEAACKDYLELPERFSGKVREQAR